MNVTPNISLGRRRTPIAQRTLQFLLDKPIPYTLIGRIIKARVRENQAKQAAKKLKK